MTQYARTRIGIRSQADRINFDKGSVVTILMEHLGLRIAIDDVIADVSY